MIDAARAARALEPFTSTIGAVAAFCSPGTTLMVIGARCRDALHAGLGRTEPTTTTSDLDLGLAIGSLTDYEEVTRRFPRIGGGRVRHLVDGQPVDLVPFGRGIEVPEGEITPSSRIGVLNVLGYEEARGTAQPLALDDELAVLLPGIDGYVLLKIYAWLDRSPRSAYKDGPDLALAMSWYQRSPTIFERLYEVETEHLIAAGYAPEIAAVRLLAADATGLLAPEHARALAARWAAQDLAVFARELRLPISGWPQPGIDRRTPPSLHAYTQAMSDVIARAGALAAHSAPDR